MAGLLKTGGGEVQSVQFSTNGIEKSRELGHKLTITFTLNPEQGKTAEALAAEAVKLLEAD